MNLICNQFLLSLREHETKTKIFVFIFYAVGIIGMLLSSTFSPFVQLIPFALILSSVLLAIFNSTKFTQKTGIVFLAIFLFSIIIEMIGVNTGLLFGSYQYGGSLGIKVVNTPLIIGLNWLILIYISASILEKYTIHPVAKVTLSSDILVIYDLVLEKVAPKLDMWTFKEPTVPIQNYVAWFLIAFIFHTAIKAFKINTTNKLAWSILLAQFIFFLVLSIFLTN